MKDLMEGKVATTEKMEKGLNNNVRILEDRSRRNNLKIDGIKEMDKETWDDCEDRIKEVLKSNLKLDGIEIERAHRLGRKDLNKQRPRTSSFKQKGLTIFTTFMSQLVKILHQKFKRQIEILNLI